MSVDSEQLDLDNWIYLQYLASDSFLAGMVGTKVSEIAHS